MKILQIEHHRNGVGGESFHAVTFKDGKATFVATVFEARGHVAVLQLGLLPDITFGTNSWRGDHYEDDLRNAIAQLYV